MKKIKLVLISIAIVGAIAGAFANTREKSLCEYSTQYRLYNGSYMLAGEYGVDYYCVGTLGVCTWYKPWPTSDWTPCRSGTYFSLDLKENLKKPTSH
jgi:hypothetical protein